MIRRRVIAVASGLFVAATAGVGLELSSALHQSVTQTATTTAASSGASSSSSAQTTQSVTPMTSSQS